MNQRKAGALLSYCNIFVNMMAGVLYTPFMLRMLGQEQYGLYSLAASIIAYLTLFDLGFGNAIVRYTAKYRAENKRLEQYQMFGMFFRLYILIGLIALSLGLLLAFNVDIFFSQSMVNEHVKIMRIMLMLMAFNLAITFPFSIFAAIISAYENFVFQRVLNLVRVIINPIVMCLFLYLGYKAIAMVIITTVFNLIILLTNCWYCFYRLKIRIAFTRINWSFLREVSIYSFWIFLNAIMNQLYWSSGQFILGVYQGAAAVAVFSVAIQLKVMYYMFSTAIAGVYLPKVTAMIAMKSSDLEISNLFIRLGRIQYIILAFIVSGFILFGKPFIRLWAGENYIEAYSLTLILFISSLIPMIQNLGIVILQARNQMKFRSLVYLFLAAICTLVSIPLSQKYGAWGCTISIGTALFVGQGIIINIYYSKKLNIDIVRFWKEILKMSVVPAGLLILGFIILRDNQLLTVVDLTCCICIFSIIYIIAIWFLSMNNYERSLLSKPLVGLYKYLLCKI